MTARPVVRRLPDIPTQVDNNFENVHVGYVLGLHVSVGHILYLHMLHYVFVVNVLGLAFLFDSNRFESIHIDVRLNRFSPSESIQKSCDNRFQSSVRIDYGLQLLCYDSFSI